MKTSKSLKIRDLSFMFAPSDEPKMGLVVSRKYGNSVQRSLFKRRCRALFKTKIIDNNISYSVVIRPCGQNISYKSIDESFALLYNQLCN